MCRQCLKQFPNGVSKPSEDFPLFPHATGRWAKKIKGVPRYFGCWADPQAALAEYHAKKDDYEQGKKPREETEGILTLKELCNQFIDHQTRRHQREEITLRSLQDFKCSCRLLLQTAGKGRAANDLDSEDFDRLAATFKSLWGIERVSKMVSFTRSLFNWAQKTIKGFQLPPYGAEFCVPSKRLKRREKAKKQPCLFPRETLQRLLEESSPMLKACILLGINAGLGNADVGSLKSWHIDLDTGWVRFDREKTGARREFRLWPETLLAIKDYLQVRPEPFSRDHEPYVFLTAEGKGYNSQGHGKLVCEMFSRLLKRCKIDGPERMGFYWLRHTFRTVADSCMDQIAIGRVMGHEDGSMAGSYRESIERSRLEKVTDTVRQWFFSSPENDQSAPCEVSSAWILVWLLAHELQRTKQGNREE